MPTIPFFFSFYFLFSFFTDVAGSGWYENVCLGGPENFEWVGFDHATDSEKKKKNMKIIK